MRIGLAFWEPVVRRDEAELTMRARPSRILARSFLGLELSRRLRVRGAAGGTAMKLLTEYLEHALAFERLAAQESNPEVRTQFESQAAAYRKLAAERAARYGLPAPSPPTQKPKAPE